MTTFSLSVNWKRSKKGEVWTTSAWCKCGAGFRMRTNNLRALDVAVDAWVAEHQGDGHGDTDAQGASRARSRQDVRA